MRWNDIATRHFNWVEAMGWHNKTVLESLALIGSEIGEVAGEVGADGTVTAAFGEELADIVLRTVDLAMTEGVDIEASLAATSVNLPSRPRHAVHVQLCDLMVEFGHWVNTARKEVPGEPFAQRLARALHRVQNLAQSQGIDLAKEVELKIEINAQRGTRGRRV